MARTAATNTTNAATDAGFRSVRFTLQLSEREAATVREAAAREHLAVAAFVRSVVLKAAEGSR